MKTHKNLYPEICDIKNLVFAWKKARKGKTKKDYVIKFEKDLPFNLKFLQKELENQSYLSRPLQTFILRDPKTRKISKSDFRDRIVHHAINNILEPIFDKAFIYDNCASRKGKGGLFALRRVEKFQRKISNNFISKGFCLKADIKHYFEEINHRILLEILQRKIKCEKTIWLLKQIIARGELLLVSKGMPLGNLTSQFFANIYLNELDQFVKHKMKVKFYVRYVDDFIIFSKSEKQLKVWKKETEIFLREKLKLELHPDKSRIINLSRGVDFVGFRIFYHYKLLRKRNIKNMQRKINLFEDKESSHKKLLESFQGWDSYAKWSDSYKLRKNFLDKIPHN
ncbi:MAG: reverse transcriptase/maturase family protein [Nanoarchaeota archaeon]|nr:reverse transcriptase/maturase family protein [Nanoarchaeota archaeon]